MPPPASSHRVPTVRRVLPSMLVVGLAAALSACTTTVDSAAPDSISSVGAAPSAVEFPERTTVAPPTPALQTVAVVGDSITVASEHAVRAELELLGLDVVALEAQVGRRMTIGERGRLVPGVEVIESIAAMATPDLWIVALGTNDVGQYPDGDTVAAQVAAVLAAIPEGVPVLWVDTWIRGRPEQIEVVNDSIRATLATRTDATVVAWSEVASEDGVISGDGVHLTPTIGTERFGRTVADAVALLLATR